MSFQRHGKFNDVPGLDKELNDLINQIDIKTGRIVKNLPPAKNQKDLNMFHVKQSNNTYRTFMAIDNQFYKKIVDGDGFIVWSVASEDDLITK